MSTRVDAPRNITLMTLRPVLVFLLLVGIPLWQLPEQQLAPLSVMILIVGTLLLTAAIEGLIDFLVLAKRRANQNTTGAGNIFFVFYLVLAAATLLYLFLQG